MKPDNIERAFRDLTLFVIFYSIGTALIKLSFALTLLRLLRDRVHKYIVNGVIVMVISITALNVFYNIFFCSPVAYNWGRATDPYFLAVAAGKDPAALNLKPGGHCKSLTSIVAVTYLHAAVLLIVDILLGMVLPIILLKDLKMKTGLKITSGVLLSLGTFASVATAVRLYYLRLLLKPDTLYNANPGLFWNDLELSWCIIATSLATLKPLANKLGLIKDSTTRPNYYYTSSGARVESKSDATAHMKPDHDDVELIAGDPSTAWAGTSPPSVIHNVIESPKDGGKGDSSSDLSFRHLEGADRHSQPVHQIRRKVDIEVRHDL